MPLHLAYSFCRAAQLIVNEIATQRAGVGSGGCLSCYLMFECSLFPVFEVSRFR